MIRINFDKRKQDDEDEYKNIMQIIFDGVWLIRIDSRGRELWKKTIGDGKHDYDAVDIALAPDGSPVLAYQSESVTYIGRWNGGGFDVEELPAESGVTLRQQVSMDIGANGQIHLAYWLDDDVGQEFVALAVPDRNKGSGRAAIWRRSALRMTPSSGKTASCSILHTVCTLFPTSQILLIANSAKLKLAVNSYLLLVTGLNC